jgi:hypothetical protein
MAIGAAGALQIGCQNWGHTVLYYHKHLRNMRQICIYCFLRSHQLKASILKALLILKFKYFSLWLKVSLNFQKQSQYQDVNRKFDSYHPLY